MAAFSFVMMIVFLGLNILSNTLGWPGYVSTIFFGGMVIFGMSVVFREGIVRGRKQENDEWMGDDGDAFYWFLDSSIYSRELVVAAAQKIADRAVVEISYAEGSYDLCLSIWSLPGEMNDCEGLALELTREATRLLYEQDKANSATYQQVSECFDRVEEKIAALMDRAHAEIDGAAGMAKSVESASQRNGKRVAQSKGAGTAVTKF